MKIRPYTESDLQSLRAIHAAQDFPYAFPDLANPLFLMKIVLTDGGPQEKIVAAALLRLTAEAYLLLDPSAGTPRERWRHLLALHAAAQQDAWTKGLEDVHAWLPPRIAKRFGRRLQRLGWIRDDAWTPYCKKLDVREVQEIKEIKEIKEVKE